MQYSFDFELYHDRNKPSKDAVLLFHGLTGNPFEMKKYGMFLYKLGFDVFCYTFPGHGERMDEIYSVTREDWCDFAQNKYDKLRSNYENFFVSGLCMGASVAIYIAENNSNVSGVISLSTTLYLDGICMPKYIFLLPIALNTVYKYYYTFADDNTLGIKNEETRKKLAKIMAKTTIGMDNYPLCCVHELLKLSKNVRKHLKKVSCPILLIHSVLDNLTSPKSAKVVFKNIASKTKKYVELNNSFHMILYDNEKKIVFESVKKFFDSIMDMRVDERKTFV